MRRGFIMGLRRNGASVYLVFCFVVLNLLSSNSDALDQLDDENAEHLRLNCGLNKYDKSTEKLPPQIEHSLLLCLINKYSSLQIPKNHRNPNFDPVLFLRRQLAAVPVPVPVPAPSPEEKTQLSFPPSQAPVPVPAPSPFLSPLLSPSPAVILPEPSRTSPPPPPLHNHHHHQNPTANSPPIIDPKKAERAENNKDDKNDNFVVRAVAFSFLGAILVAFIFLCCYRCKKKRRDEMPFSRLSLSEFSGSSHNSGPIDVNKLGSLHNGSNHNSSNHTDSNHNGSSHNSSNQPEQIHSLNIQSKLQQDSPKITKTPSIHSPPINQPATPKAAPPINQPATPRPAPPINQPATPKPEPSINQPSTPKAAPPINQPAPPKPAPPINQPATPKPAPSINQPATPKPAPPINQPATPRPAPPINQPATPKPAPSINQPATPKAAPPINQPAPPKPAPPPPAPPAPPPPAPKPAPPPLAVKKPAGPPPPPKTAGPAVFPPPHLAGKGRPGLSKSTDLDAEGDKPKLKPFFWDKVAMGNGSPDQSMVWDQIKAGSFQFSEEHMESLFGVTTNKSKNNKKDPGSKENTPQYIKLLEPKKSQNLAISLKAKNVKIEHVIEAVNEGNELPKELIETLIKMKPTQDEELKLRLFNGDDNLLGPAEQFYKVLIDIPFVFKRLNALLYMSNFHEESSEIKRDFSTLEVACGELKGCRLFLKLLEAVLKLGNRMNSGTFRGGAQAFKLDTLLKLSDVKGTDGKTTLLHFVVQEIVRSEGLRSARQNPNPNSNPSSEEEMENYYFTLGLNVVSSLGEELVNVKKAAGLDIDLITNSVASLGSKLVDMRQFLERFVQSVEGECGFRNVLEYFVENATGEAEYLIEQEKKIRGVVKSTVDYFHGNNGKDEGLRLFVIVRDFMGVLDRVCKEVRASASKPVQRRRVRGMPGSGSGSGSSIPDPRQHLFPKIKDQRVDSSSSSSDED